MLRNFEGGLYLVTSGSNGDVHGFGLSLTSSISIVGKASFSIDATYDNSESLWDISVSTPGNLLQFTSPSLNEYLSISWSISPGDEVVMASDTNAMLGSGGKIWGVEQGLWQLSASAFGWGAELPGDTDEDDDVDGDDRSNFEGGFGMASDATLSDGDMNADGDVDGNDFLVWQRYFGSASPAAPAASSTAVPEPSTALLSIFALVVCMASRPLRRKSSNVAGSVW